MLKYSLIIHGHCTADLLEPRPTETEAREIFGDRLTVTRFEFAHNDRLIAE